MDAMDLMDNLPSGITPSLHPPRDLAGYLCTGNS